MITHKFGKLKIDKDGIIYHDDIPFEHENTAKFFKKHIVKENGSYFIRINANTAPIEVEDVILWVENIDINIDKSEVILNLSDETNIIINQYTELSLENDFLYYESENIRAKFLRKPFNELMNYLSDSYQDYILEIGNLKIKINN